MAKWFRFTATGVEVPDLYKKIEVKAENLEQAKELFSKNWGRSSLESYTCQEFDEEAEWQEYIKEYEEMGASPCRVDFSGAWGNAQWFSY